jgi:predicted ATPase
MVSALAGEALPAETLDALIARADGVPLYVEELVKTLIDPGATRGRCSSGLICRGEGGGSA